VNANVHPVFQPLLDAVAGKRESPALRFIRDEGDVNIPAVCAELLRRLNAYPTRHEDDVICNLNYEVSAEKMRWEIENGKVSVVSAREARELSTDGRIA
jgi:hypothetical protein